MVQSIIAGDQLIEPRISVKSLPGVSRREGAVHSSEGDRKYKARSSLRYDVNQKKAMISILKTIVTTHNSINP